MEKNIPEFIYRTEITWQEGLSGTIYHRQYFKTTKEVAEKHSQEFVDSTMKASRPVAPNKILKVTTTRYIIDAVETCGVKF